MGTWCWQLSRILRRMVKIPRIRTLKSRRYRRMEAQDGRDGRRTRFVFVLRSVYHCSDELLRVTNRLCLPSRRLLGCARHSLRQFEPHQFCCDAQHCAHNQRAKVSDNHVMRVVSTCQFAERFERKTPCSAGARSAELHSAHTSHALHCLAARTGHTEDAYKSGGQRTFSGGCRTFLSNHRQLLGDVSGWICCLRGRCVWRKEERRACRHFPPQRR
jgi:hypothetical protein